MKQLKDLKEEILANNIKNFYVFYGQDFGLRQHYIHKIGSYYDKIKVLYKQAFAEISKEG